MKFYIDEEGNRYAVDRETGERTLIETAEKQGEVAAPIPSDNEEKDG